MQHVFQVYGHASTLVTVHRQDSATHGRPRTALNAANETRTETTADRLGIPVTAKA